jgi:hypothetical protein
MSRLLVSTIIRAYLLCAMRLPKKIRFGTCRYAAGSTTTNGTSNANNRLILKYHKNVMTIEYVSKKCIV